MTEKHLDILGVIPARLASTRLPRKVLRDIAGAPLVARVYEAAMRSPLISRAVVAADSDEVVEACNKRSIPVLLTSPKHASGSDRLYEVLEKEHADIYVNIQGDEPLLKPEHIEALVRPFFNRVDVRVSTLKVAISQEQSLDPNVVKVVSSVSGRAIYFSRNPIPYDRDNRNVQRYKHIGLYAYRKEALAEFHALPASGLQIAESLEQLKLIENDLPIHVFETEFDTVGVDTEEDLARVRAVFAGIG
jgi:3-deoxy-manno-octulosonate cytidylyltransferase (CMP-KDO synthetase)